jgi:hypothetical protein
LSEKFKEKFEVRLKSRENAGGEALRMARKLMQEVLKRKR